MLRDWWVWKSLHRPGLTPAYGLRRAKVVFSAPSIPFRIYHLYKFRELSSFYLQNYFLQRAGEERIDLHRPGLTSAYGLRRDISRVWANRGAERRMGATHHLVLNVRFRESKSTVKVKSFFRPHQSHFASIIYTNSENWVLFIYKIIFYKGPEKEAIFLFIYRLNCIKIRGEIFV